MKRDEIINNLNDELLSYKEIAGIIAVSKQTIRNIAKETGINKKGITEGNKILFKKEDTIKLINAYFNKQEGKAEELNKTRKGPALAGNDPETEEQYISYLIKRLEETQNENKELQNENKKLNEEIKGALRVIAQQTGQVNELKGKLELLEYKTAKETEKEPQNEKPEEVKNPDKYEEKTQNETKTEPESEKNEISENKKGFWARLFNIK